MDPFNGNERLQNNIMYALDWAIFLRHNIDDSLVPFLFEYKGEEIYKSMLQPGGDPEEFAYRLAEKSTRDSDQFVVGYEGMLTNEKGEKMDAFIMKGYDKTQPKGVFLAQIFTPREKSGNFELVDNPVFISNPDLPFDINNEITPNYKDIELYSSGMALKNGDRVGIFSHDNPSVISNGIKQFLRSKVSLESDKISGNFECAIAPNGHGGEFLKYTLLRTIQAEKQNKWIKEWESKTGKRVNVNCKYGEDIWLKEYADEENLKEDDRKSDKSEALNEHEQLVSKYLQMNQFELDAEFQKIISIPNARTNLEALTKMTALMEAYEKKGLSMPDRKKNPESKKSKSGCGASVLFMIVLMILFVL